MLNRVIHEAARHLAAMVIVSLPIVGCDRDAPGPSGDTVPSSASTVAPAKASEPSLPKPFDGLHMGMSKSDVLELFRPTGDVSSCDVRLVGPMPGEQAPADGKPHTRCVRAEDVGGATVDERKEAASGGKRLEPTNEVRAGLIADGVLLAIAQVRGGLRAGTLPLAPILAASVREKSEAESILFTAAKLVDGSIVFASAQSSRRPIAAVFLEDCTGVDHNDVRTYILGGFSLGDLDSRARARVAYGKCRGPYVQNERHFQRAFVAATGGLAGIGLARSAAKDRALIPEEPASFATFTTRSRLDGETARLGVLVANALEETERFYAPALFVVPSSEAANHLAGAMVWFADDAVSRIVFNLASSDLEPLVAEFETMHGSPTREGLRTTWKTKDSATTIVLDAGAAMMMTITR